MVGLNFNVEKLIHLHLEKSGDKDQVFGMHAREFATPPFAQVLRLGGLGDVVELKDVFSQLRLGDSLFSALIVRRKQRVYTESNFHLIDWISWCCDGVRRQSSVIPIMRLDSARTYLAHSLNGRRSG
jgi:hypothetical protein